MKKLTMYSTVWCKDCIRAKFFFDANGIDYEEIDIDEHPEHIDYIAGLNNGNRKIPTIIIEYEDGSEKILIEPDNDELEKTFS